MYFKDAEYMAEKACHILGNERVDLKITSSFETVKTYLQYGRAGLISVHGSSSFSNHTMVLLGYKEYTYESGRRIFKETKTAYFYQVDDGDGYKKNKYNKVFFDPNTSAKPSLNFAYLYAR